MKFATLPNGTPDGRLVLVSPDLRRCAAVGALAPTLQIALERWTEIEPALRELQDALDSGRSPNIEAFDAESALAPLPRAWQWLDGSAFKAHGDLMATVFKLDPISYERPLMYQGISDHFIAPTADVPLPSEADGIDFEAEFGVITDTVPMGVSREEALKHIRLVVLINDWSLRRHAPIEMKTGFGWIHAKPATSLGPIAVTPDELGSGWSNARCQMHMEVDWNGRRFGAPHAGVMAFGFDQLVAHAAYSRELVAGTVIGSGTISNDDYRVVGSACIAERRAIELLDAGSSTTPYMSFGDHVRLQARYEDGSEAPFGVIHQRVVANR